MKQEELDSILQVLENPVRRRIIKRLSQEPCYALQLSKELGLGQALVAKHLSLMERAGLVASTRESSPNGPSRRRYAVAKNISINVDLAPNVFIERAVVSGGSFAEEKKTSRKAALMSRRVQEALKSSGDDRLELSFISEILNDLDYSIAEVEKDRIALIAVRNKAMSEVARIAAKQQNSDKKRVLFHILDEHDKEVESISTSLNLRELVVRTILDELERELFG